MRPRTELLFLPGGIGSLPHRSISGGGGVVKICLLLLYYGLSYSVGRAAGTLHLRLFVSVRLVSGAAAQNSDQKDFHKKLKGLTYIKYAVLLIMVVLLPALAVNDVGMGDPFFCKYLCPQGVLEGAIPLAAVDSGLRDALGALFSWKFGILIVTIVLSVLFYRPFCKWLCPLGAFYALLNKVSLLGMKVDKHKCVSCGKCAKACKMDVDVTKSPDHTECIRCGMCVRACPTEAVKFRYGFCKGKDDICSAKMRSSKNIQ